MLVDGSRVSYDLTPDIEYLEDPSHSLSFEDLKSITDEGRFVTSSSQGRINFGYSSSAYWLRVRLNTVQAGHWLLEVAYPTLDRVDLYCPGPSGAATHLRSGDLLSFSERPHVHRNLVFPVDLPLGPSTLYLRVESEGSMTIPATLWNPEAFTKRDFSVYSVLALYYGTLLALGGYNLLLYFSIRDRAYLEYVLFAAGMAVGMASTNGFAQQFLWPEWPAWGNIAFPIGFSIAGLFGAMFTRSFLDTGRTAPSMDKVLRGLLALFALSAAAHVASYRTAAILVSLGGLGVSVTSLSAGVAAWRRGHPGARFFLLAWTLLLVGVGIMALRNFGWLPTNAVTEYSMQVGSTLELLLLSFALADRINTVRSENEAAQAELISTKQVMLETLRRSEEDLEKRVELRTRELETANARLRENELTLSRLARQDALTGLGNRIALEEEMIKALGRSGRLGTHVGIMLIDLDRFKPVNDEHGHGIGDEVLRLAAGRLLECTRKTDMVARLGGDEFVVVLEGRNVMTDAHGVAGKILASMNEDVTVHDLTLRIGSSIGIAISSAGHNTPEDLLRRADKAMYAAKREGGNRYVMEAERTII